MRLSHLPLKICRADYFWSDGTSVFLPKWDIPFNQNDAWKKFKKHNISYAYANNHNFNKLVKNQLVADLRRLT